MLPFVGQGIKAPCQRCYWVNKGNRHTGQWTRLTIQLGSIASRTKIPAVAWYAPRPAEVDVC